MPAHYATTFKVRATVEEVGEFTYLGSKMTSSGKSRLEVSHRISLAASAMDRLHQIWHDQHIFVHSKALTYQSLILSILLYAGETWTYGYHILSCPKDDIRAYKGGQSQTKEISSKIHKTHIQILLRL